MTNFSKVMLEYLGVTSIESAKVWVSKQMCSTYRAEKFASEYILDMMGERKWRTEDSVKDYVDSLRRAPYVGMGI